MNGQHIRSLSKLQWKLFLAQGRLCFWCGERMFAKLPPGFPTRLGVTKEHVFPHGSTGRGLVNNIVLSHAGCNGERGARQPTAAEIARAARLWRDMGMEPFVPAALWQREHGRFDSGKPKGTTA